MRTTLPNVSACPEFQSHGIEDLRLVDENLDPMEWESIGGDGVAVRRVIAYCKHWVI